MTVRRRLIFAIGVAAASASVLADAPLPPAVKAAASGIGRQFLSADGRTLYVYDRDEKRGESACEGKCAETWPPLTSQADTIAVGEWSPIARPDGTKQWAFRGRPVYTFAKDTSPGMTLGDGFQDIWHVAIDVAPRPNTIKFQGTVLGRVAADSRGMTLYTRDSKEPCVGTCLEAWTPLLAPWIAHGIGQWSVLPRSDDHTMQWAYQGRMVYSSQKDIRPGDTNGDGADKVWHAVVLQPIPPLPSWLTIQPSDLGPIFANANGATLYTVPDLATLKREATCDDACFATHWTPVTPKPDDKPSGNWTIIPGRDGTPQWAYRGALLFTYNGDKKPSEITGQNFAMGGGFGGFRVIVRGSLKPETL